MKIVLIDSEGIKTLHEFEGATPKDSVECLEMAIKANGTQPVRVEVDSVFIEKELKDFCKELKLELAFIDDEEDDFFESLMGEAMDEVAKEIKEEMEDELEETLTMLGKASIQELLSCEVTCVYDEMLRRVHHHIDTMLDLTDGEENRFSSKAKALKDSIKKKVDSLGEKHGNIAEVLRKVGRFILKLVGRILGIAVFLGDIIFTSAGLVVRMVVHGTREVKEASKTIKKSFFRNVLRR